MYISILLPKSATKPKEMNLENTHIKLTKSIVNGSYEFINLIEIKTNLQMKLKVSLVNLNLVIMSLMKASPVIMSRVKMQSINK